MLDPGRRRTEKRDRETARSDKPSMRHEPAPGARLSAGVAAYDTLAFFSADSILEFSSLVCFVAGIALMAS